MCQTSCQLLRRLAQALLQRSEKRVPVRQLGQLSQIGFQRQLPSCHSGQTCGEACCHSLLVLRKIRRKAPHDLRRGLLPAGLQSRLRRCQLLRSGVQLGLFIIQFPSGLLQRVVALMPLCPSVGQILLACRQIRLLLRQSPFALLKLLQALLNHFVRVCQLLPFPGQSLPSLLKLPPSVCKRLLALFQLRPGVSQIFCRVCQLLFPFGLFILKLGLSLGKLLFCFPLDILIPSQGRRRYKLLPDRIHTVDEVRIFLAVQAMLLRESHVDLRKIVHGKALSGKV